MSESEGEWSPWGGEEEEEEQPLVKSPLLEPQRSAPDTMGDISITTPLVNQRAARTSQYITAFSATMGALALGTVLGYASPAGPKLMSNSTSDFIHLTKDQNSLFSSIVNIGALVGGPVGGVCLNHLGRRNTMLASVPPFIGGWLLILFGQNFTMLMAGRILNGLCSGITSIAVPTYIAEYASPEIRGTLGSGFQLMVTLGVLYAYVLGAVVSSWRLLAGLNIIPLVGYFILMCFAKESPSFLLSKRKEEKAADALQHFRGRNSHIQTELDMMRVSVEEGKRNKASVADLLKPHILKPLLISLCIMFFQQFSGVNGILFNLTTIFNNAGSDLSSNMSSIIVGLVQVAGTFLATVLMDKAGRKLLLIVSSSIMALSLVALGEYFYMSMEDSAWARQNLGWLPLLALIVYVAAFSLGYGPIPWLMMGELFSPNVKELAASQATLFNWSMSFVVTYIFVPVETAIGDYGVYWLFSGFCVLNLIFCVSLVPETKGKSLEEITALFGGSSPTATQGRRNSSDC